MVNSHLANEVTMYEDEIRIERRGKQTANFKSSLRKEFFYYHEGIYHENQKRFLDCSNQRKVLISLATLELGELFPIEKCGDCGEDLIQHGKKLLKPGANIFWNNYSNQCSDKASSGASGRKVKTFS